MSENGPPAVGKLCREDGKGEESRYGGREKTVEEEETGYSERRPACLLRWLRRKLGKRTK